MGDDCEYCDEMSEQNGVLSEDLADAEKRIVALEDLITEVPQLAWRFDCGQFPGTSVDVMPDSDRQAATGWLHRVHVERTAILKRRMP